MTANQFTNLVYVVSRCGDVSVIDGKTNAVRTTINVDESPWSISVNPLTNRAYVTKQHDNTVAVIDIKTNKVIHFIPVGIDPNVVSVNPSTNVVYVTNYGNRSVSVINSTTNSVITTIPVGNSPRDISVNPSTNMVYVANSNDNSVTVIDGKTNKVIDIRRGSPVPPTVFPGIPVGRGPDGLSVNPSTNMVYVANYDDTDHSTGLVEIRLFPLLMAQQTK